MRRRLCRRNVDGRFAPVDSGLEEASHIDVRHAGSAAEMWPSRPAWPYQTNPTNDCGSPRMTARSAYDSGSPRMTQALPAHLCAASVTAGNSACRPLITSAVICQIITPANPRSRA